MGIVDELLAEFELTSIERCRIEQDVNGTIHIHLDGFRLELSPHEFEEFVAIVEEAQQQLHKRKVQNDEV